MILSLDDNKCTLLASLDLTAAFDTIEHSIFIRRLIHLFRVDGTALQWFCSYLDNRDLKVCIRNLLSKPHMLKCGIPQGSVIGARLFTTYTHPLSCIINNHNLMYHSYADDTKIYLHCENNYASIRKGILRLQRCIADVCTWMSRNALKLNEDKTELIIFRGKQHDLSTTYLQVSSNNIPIHDNIKFLGVILDPHMTLDQQISSTSKSAYMHIRKINSIRQYLIEAAVKTVVQSLVVSRLDYCNSIYVGLPLKPIRRLATDH